MLDCLRRAAVICGSTQQLAIDIGVSRQAMYKWTSIPDRYVRKIVKAQNRALQEQAATIRHLRTRVVSEAELRKAGK